jgi:hypothetical protein
VSLKEDGKAGQEGVWGTGSWQSRAKSTNSCFYEAAIEASVQVRSEYRVQDIDEREPKGPAIKLVMGRGIEAAVITGADGTFHPLPPVDLNYKHEFQYPMQPSSPASVPQCWYSQISNPSSKVPPTKP